MLQGSLIILAFVIIAALMMTKKIPTLLALPLMAVVICLIAGVPAVGVNAEGTNIGWLQTVLEAGTVRMGSAIMAVVFGAWLGQLMNKTGVTENKGFEVYMLVATVIATLILVFVEFKRNGVKFAFSAPVEDAQPTKQLSGVRGGLAMLTPLIPIILVAAFKVPVCPAFMAGIIWILLFTSKSFSKAMNTLVKTCYDGITDGGPAIILMIGIGILYLAVTHPMVKEVLNPFLLAVVPSNKVAYIIFFSLLAPLSLYRGPMNLFGLGSGIAALVIGLGTLSPMAVMGAFLAAERIQGCGDPTNTQNVWTANFAEVDVNGITKKLLPYLWAVAVIGVVISAVLYF